MKKYRAIGIEWDTDFKTRNECGLPIDAEIKAENKEFVADALSDKYGFCINSISFITEIEHEIYIVHGYYDMNIGVDEEILIEPYANEGAARNRVRELITNYKENHGDGTLYCDEWDEEEFRLYAYEDSEWNVDIYYESVTLKQ